MTQKSHLQCQLLSNPRISPSFAGGPWWWSHFKATHASCCRLAGRHGQYKHSQTGRLLQHSFFSEGWFDFLRGPALCAEGFLQRSGKSKGGQHNKISASAAFKRASNSVVLCCGSSIHSHLCFLDGLRFRQARHRAIFESLALHSTTLQDTRHAMSLIRPFTP